MGKAGFAHLLQGGERLQIYVKKDAVPEKDYSCFSCSISATSSACEGYLFRTRTGELSVHVEKLHFLSKIAAPACRRSGTGWKMWRRATASATST